MQRKTLVLLHNMILLGLIIIPFVVSAQQPPHPTLQGHGATGNQSPGSEARIEDGAAIMIAFALAYGYQKLRKSKIQTQVADQKEE